MSCDIVCLKSFKLVTNALFSFLYTSYRRIWNLVYMQEIKFETIAIYHHLLCFTIQLNHTNCWSIFFIHEISMKLHSNFLDVCRYTVSVLCSLHFIGTLQFPTPPTYTPNDKRTFSIPIISRKINLIYHFFQCNLRKCTWFRYFRGKMIHTLAYQSCPTS